MRVCQLVQRSEVNLGQHTINYTASDSNSANILPDVNSNCQGKPYGGGHRQVGERNAKLNGTVSSPGRKNGGGSHRRRISESTLCEVPTSTPHSVPLVGELHSESVSVNSRRSSTPTTNSRMSTHSNSLNKQRSKRTNSTDLHVPVPIAMTMNRKSATSTKDNANDDDAPSNVPTSTMIISDIGESTESAKHSSDIRTAACDPIVDVTKREPLKGNGASVDAGGCYNDVPSEHHQVAANAQLSNEFTELFITAAPASANKSGDNCNFIQLPGPTEARPCYSSQYCNVNISASGITTPDAMAMPQSTTSFETRTNNSCSSSRNNIINDNNSNINNEDSTRDSKSPFDDNSQREPQTKKPLHGSGAQLDETVCLFHCLFICFLPFLFVLFSYCGPMFYFKNEIQFR